MANLEEIRVPREHVNDESVTILEWLVEDAEMVDKGQPLALVDTSKSVSEVTAPCDGYFKRAADENDDVDVGSVIGYVGADLSSFGEIVDRRDRETKAESGDENTRFSRKALEMIQKEGLDESVFAGRGLVREKDVLCHLEGSETSQSEDFRSETLARESGQRSSDSVAVDGVEIRREKLSRRKRTEIRRLRSAFMGTLPSSATVSVSTRDKTRAVEKNPEITEILSATIIFETARLLRKYPCFNAVFEDDYICYYEEVNIGFAIDGDEGLKVPVIRHADKKTVREILTEQREIIIKYVDNTIPLESLAGGTFTLSNLSGEGVETFGPIINQGQSAILGVGADSFPTGASAIGCYKLILVFDHQLSEGRQAARFLRALRERLTAHEDALLTAVVIDQDSSEPYCNFCLKPLSELREQDRYLLRTVGPRGEPKFVCGVCFQGW